MKKLYIREEYGYREWVAELTDEEWEALQTRWRTLRGLFCSVPVRLIVPQARELRDDADLPNLNDPSWLHCHLHECDDSYLDGVDYTIPADHEAFWMDGRRYTHQEVFTIADYLNGPRYCLGEWVAWVNPDGSPCGDGIIKKSSFGSLTVGRGGECWFHRIGNDLVDERLIVGRIHSLDDLARLRRRLTEPPAS